jgi:hypothetical protein
VGYNYGQDKTMNKNWKEIAGCSNEQLRLNLVSAKGEIAEGLAKGFPQYFLADGETHPLISRSAFLAGTQSIDRRDELVAALKAAGLPHERFSFEGSSHARTTESVPYSDGGYNTTANGRGEYFFRSTAKVGAEVDYQGAKWVVVWNKYSPGCPSWFASHSFIIVPTAAFAL